MSILLAKKLVAAGLASAIFTVAPLFMGDRPVAKWTWRFVGPGVSKHAADRIVGVSRGGWRSVEQIDQQ